MREVTEVTELAGIVKRFPNVRKVTVDTANKTLYVFNGRSNQATVVTGAEFERLVKTLPGEEPDTPAEPGAADTEGDEAAEAKPTARAKRPKEK